MTEDKDQFEELEDQFEEDPYLPEEDEDYSIDGLLTGTKYDVPEDADAFLNPETGEVVNKEDLTPLEIIKAIAKQNNQDIQNPKPSCNYCYGRGFEGKDSKTQMPIPCRCLFRGKADTEKLQEIFYDSNRMQGKANRAWRRRVSKTLKRQFRNIKKTYVKSKDNEKSKTKVTAKTVNKVLNEYIKRSSFKKTAKCLNMTLTSVKNIVKENRTKLDKLIKKANKETANG